MAFQALLFCPDEKIAAIVTQVLGELEFGVVPCAEPFAAVKRLMAERFDAVVVDLDNEQNAALLFKSARGSASNQNALAVAVVEGQAGVAKAFRLGANLVLTKPVNVEQAKGTLRVARGLLKKNELARAAAAANAPASQAPPQKPFTPPPAEISLEAVSEPFRSDVGVAKQPSTSKPTLVSKAATSSASVQSAPTAGPRLGATASAGGSASAPAPAREREIVQKPEESATPVDQDVDAVVVEDIGVEASPEPVAQSAEKPYPFTFGGTNREESSAAPSGATKKLLIVAAAVLGAAAGYYAWTSGTISQFLNSKQSVAAPAKVAPVVSSPAPATVQPTAPATISSDAAASTANDSATPDIVLETKPSPAKSTASSKKVAPVTSVPAPAPAAKPEAPPIVMGHSLATTSKKPETDVAAPDAVVMSSTGAASLPGISSAQPVLPKPPVGTMKISQGISQGLLVKRVQPNYPQNALQAHIEGDVSLVATISKTGDITSVTVASGSALFTKAAVDAVREWKYKPYLLNGEPVEIQTDITVRFKLPR
jgi:periplasmic protein TonB